MAKNYTTKTSALKATTADFRKVDTKKLNINGNPFSKVVTDHVPETPTANDIWKYAVTTDDEGIVTITDDVAVDFSEITTAQKNITKTAVKVIDNKVLNANGTLLMNWDTKNFTNENGKTINSIFSRSKKITEWSSDLSSLASGYEMFNNTSLQSFSGDLSNLTDGERMFYGAPLQSFSGDLLSLIKGKRMFSTTSLQSFSGDLSNLTDGYMMFNNTALESFNGDLSSLTGGGYMFYGTALESFRGDLSSLTYGYSMFHNTALQSFNGDLPNLSYAYQMFYNTALQSFSGDLSSLASGYSMFHNTALQSFNGDLSSLAHGYRMFYNTQARHYELSFYKMVNGVKTNVTETFQSEGLKDFISNLSSLKSGYQMFGDSAETASPLSEESIMFIADTINDISELNVSNAEHWKYTYINSNGSESTTTISESLRGILHLGYDSSITDTTNIFKYCEEIVDKGWTVYLNGSQYTSADSGSTTLIDGESTSTPIPHYYKPVQVTDEEIAEYVDANNNYYIIVGGQHVFGDDVSTYGMFTSYEHAVQEITAGLGLTKYEKPSTETNNN